MCKKINNTIIGPDGKMNINITSALSPKQIKAIIIAIIVIFSIGIILTAVLVPIFTVQLTHIKQHDASCEEAGNYEYYINKITKQCFEDKDGKKPADKSYFYIPPKGHSLTRFEAAPADCTHAGNIGYWQCETCKKCFSDGNGKSEIDINDVTQNALGHTMPNIPITSDNWLWEENYSKATLSYVCDRCGENRVFTATASKSYTPATCETDGNEIFNVTTTIDSGISVSDRKTITIPALGHNPKHVEAKSPDCTNSGNLEYWKCSTCNSYFTDSNCTLKTALNNVKLNALGHTAPDMPVASGNWQWKTDYSEATLSYICSRCGGKRIFTATASRSSYNPAKCETDGEATYSVTVKIDGGVSVYDRKTVTLPALGHNPKHIEAKSPTCTNQGNLEYWECLGCNKFFSDSTCKSETTSNDITISVLEHNPEHIEAKSPDCTTPGNLEYWKCSTCSTCFSDSNGKFKIDIKDVTQNALGHDTYRSAKNPTYTEEGYIEERCTRCSWSEIDESSIKPTYLSYSLAEDGWSYKVYKCNYSLTSVNVPETYKGLPITSIMSTAFENATTLESIIIPNSVTSIDFGAFKGCKNLQSISVPFVGANKNGTGNTYFGYIFGIDNYKQLILDYYDDDLYYNEQYISEYNIRTETIKNLRNVTITGGTQIEENAFRKFGGITNIFIPDSVVRIGKLAFDPSISIQFESVKNYEWQLINDDGSTIGFTSTNQLITHYRDYMRYSLRRKT